MADAVQWVICGDWLWPRRFWATNFCKDLEILLQMFCNCKLLGEKIFFHYFHSPNPGVNDWSDFFAVELQIQISSRWDCTLLELSILNQMATSVKRIQMSLFLSAIGQKILHFWNNWFQFKWSNTIHLVLKLPPRLQYFCPCLHSWFCHSVTQVT